MIRSVIKAGTNGVLLPCVDEDQEEEEQENLCMGEGAGSFVFCTQRLS